MCGGGDAEGESVNGLVAGDDGADVKHYGNEGASC